MYFKALILIMAMVCCIACKQERTTTPSPSNTTEKQVAKVKNTEQKQIPQTKTEAKTTASTKQVAKTTEQTLHTNQTKKRSPIKTTIKKTKKAKATKSAKIVFLKDKFDFGFIEEGKKVKHTFKFINTGNAPLGIENVLVSCGCTTPVFPFMDIEPGHSGEITVHFDSDGRLGSQEATINVLSNASNADVELKLTGVIRAQYAKNELPTADSSKQK